MKTLTADKKMARRISVFIGSSQSVTSARCACQASGASAASAAGTQAMSRNRGVSAMRVAAPPAQPAVVGLQDDTVVGIWVRVPGVKTDGPAVSGVSEDDCVRIDVLRP